MTDIGWRVHECSICGRAEQWGPNWHWYGSYRDLDDGVVLKICSPECRAEITNPDELLARLRRSRFSEWDQ